ncbi:alpha/beta hydrolase, partial [Lactobacillus nasalidis]
MVVTVNNIAYDLKHGLKTDIYYPNDTDSETKILIFWHGGGWFRGSKDSVRDVGIDLANAGFMTFIPDYRLAPQHHFPAAHDDALNFAAWLLASDYTDAGDENNIVQIGASSGGTLALKVAGMYGFPTVTWSAPVDFSNWLASHQQVKASVNAKEEFGLVKQQAINDAFYKYFTLTYAGSDDSDVLEELDAQNYDYTKLNRLLLINSAAELTDLAGVSDFAARLAGRGHQV